MLSLMNKYNFIRCNIYTSENIFVCTRHVGGGHGIWPLVTFDVMSDPPWKRVMLFSVHLKGMLMLLNLDVLNS